MNGNATKEIMKNQTSVDIFVIKETNWILHWNDDAQGLCICDRRRLWYNQLIFLYSIVFHGKIHQQPVLKVLFLIHRRITVINSNAVFVKNDWSGCWLISHCSQCNQCNLKRVFLFLTNTVDDKEMAMKSIWIRSMSKLPFFLCFENMYLFVFASLVFRMGTINPLTYSTDQFDHIEHHYLVARTKKSNRVLAMLIRWGKSQAFRNVNTTELSYDQSLNYLYHYPLGQFSTFHSKLSFSFEFKFPSNQPQNIDFDALRCRMLGLSLI